MKVKPLQKIEADWRALLELTATPDLYQEDLDLLYRATSASANVGRVLEVESKLTETQRRIHHARRFIFASDYKRAEEILADESDLTPILRGDRLCLLAIIAHRESHDWGRARDLMIAAAKIFETCGEFHRMIRARINSLICARDLGEYDQGALYALEQECIRRGYHDQAGLIQRGRTIELLNEGEFTRALTEGERALESYKLDGCPEDRSVALAIVAISKFLNGKHSEANSLAASIPVRSERTQSYLQILDHLQKGKTPTISNSHPLGRVPWKKANSSKFRRSSTYGRILELIRQRPYPRHELIEAIWGKNSCGVSYDNRLYVAIATLRKKHGICVEFDGERYRAK